MGGCRVLEAYLGVECRVLYCQTVDDLLTQLTEIRQHFAREGTPIMMGVGQKAFSIVGLCEGSKNTAFLVVDPHFAGSDSQTGTTDRVGWKDLEFFKKAGSGHANLCLPGVPRSEAVI